MSNKIKNVTRKDVARLANVSHMTVTRVLNGSPLVKEETCRKVLAACEQLQFRKNLVASSLRSRKSHSIAVIVPTFRHEFYSRLLADIETEAQKDQYCVITSQFLGPDQSQKYLEWEKISNLLCRNVDGIILDCELEPEIERRLAMESVPVVCINRDLPQKLFDAVLSDYSEDFSRLTRMLISRGHRKILFAGGFVENPEFGDSYNGYRTEMKRNHLPSIRIGCGFSFEDGVNAAEELVRKQIKCTAVMCISDYVAIGLISCLEKYGVKVPEDISVTGYAGDDISRFYRPSITTGQQPVHEIALNAVRRLLFRISHPEIAERLEMRLPARIIERESTSSLE